MRFYFHEEAESEFEQAVEYYERQRAGLGLDFAQEVSAAIVRVIRFPSAWPGLTKNTRRCLLNRFPFALIYQVKADAVRVIAVAHLRRRPGYWRERQRT